MKGIAKGAMKHRTARVVEQTLPAANSYRWAMSPWARWFRNLTHWWLVGRHVRRYCQPLKVEGLEHLASLRGPVIFVANHTSHFDAYVVRSMLPGRWRRHTAMAAAADRWYTRKKLRVAWLSLVLNIYPIQRGGGHSALDYSTRLLDRGWSLMIFPEGTRAKNGHLEDLKYGVAILALRHRAPVVPIYLDGVADVLPPKERVLRPAPVTAHIGKPLAFEPTTSVSAATDHLQDVLEAMAPVQRSPEAVLSDAR